MILADILKKSKQLIINKDHTYYQSKKMEGVPCEAVEELLGIKFKRRASFYYGKI
ncbi:DUF3173 family protein [Breznakia pachnodae]|uniref:DUF3173 family protein n=1 Tax=Breznakia pachnodae TaxID=265178 RepID=UPI0035220956